MSIVKSLVVAALAGAITVAGAASAQSLLPYDGPEKWETTAVTMSSSHPDINGARLAALSEEWGGVMDVTIVDGPADIEFVEAAECRDGGEHCGGEARYEHRWGSHYLSKCTVAVLPGQAKDMILSHELGHCFGLTHNHGSYTSNMHWMAQDYKDAGGWADAPTADDVARLASLYR